MAIIEDEDNNHQQPSHLRTLPTEIIIELLLKLPVESLLRCKSVCKSWFSLISQPQFIKSHFNLSAPRLIFSINYGSILKTFCLNDVKNGNIIDNSLVAVDCPFQRGGKPVMVLGSCNGLVCLDVFSPNDGVLFFWNISTRKCYRLPSDGYTINVEFKLFGFGYDESNDDYKVVSVSLRFYKLPSGGLETFVKMYSLRNGSWKDVDVFPHGRPSGFGKFVNGALHWVAFDGGYSKLISFDLATETYGEVSLPVYDEDEMDLKLGILGERLCVICDYFEIRMDLWTMMVYGVEDSWNRLVTVSYAPDPEMHYLLAPLCVANDGRILLTFGTKLMIYDSTNGLYSDVESFDKRVEGSTFAESLVSPMPHVAALGDRDAGSNG